ncbi:MAG: spermidine/putrescine ABC transporter substrate-binding protein, partial [Magnetococcales bacterium]|nr:spermidine/putrescine ABC transporter substrate-binding protein [Magnetococcales bacterium]
QAETAKKGELTLLTWPDYIDPEVIAAFEKQRGVTVRQIYFESDQERDQQIVRKGSDAFDVIVVNRVHLPFYAKQGWVTSIDKGGLKQFAHLDPRWLPEADGSGKLPGIPYFWGNIGLAYRDDKLVDKPVGWMDFFRPAEALHGRIQAMESDRELFGMALKALGYSVNSEENVELLAAEALLREQKPHVMSYRYTDLTAEAPLVKGEAWMAIVFNGDALKLREFHPEIRYLHPREGSTLWIDDLVIGGGSKRRDLALAFIDHLNEPDMAARNAETLHFATPNKTAMQRASKAYLDDPIIFPPEEVWSLSETIRPLAPRIQRRVNDIVSRLIQP